MRRCAQHGGSRPLLDLPLFLRVLLQILHRFPLGFMDSATSDFCPLTFSLCLEPFCFRRANATFSRLCRTPFVFSSDCNDFLKRFIFCLFRVLDPLVFISRKGGGGSCRRQGKSAAPQRAGVWCSLGPAGAGSARLSNTFYSVLGQGLGDGPDHLGGSGRHSPIIVRFRCFFSGVAVAAAFGWQGQ